MAGDATVEEVCGLMAVDVAGEAVAVGGEVVTVPPVLLDACKAGAGAAVKTIAPELLPVGDDAGASLGAASVEFTEGERFVEAKRFNEDRSMAGATDPVLT